MTGEPHGTWLEPGWNLGGTWLEPWIQRPGYALDILDGLGMAWLFSSW